MPRYDMTGPRGLGPMTGRKLGKCKGENMNVKAPKSDIVEKTTKKTIHGKDTPASSEKIVENILGSKYED